MYTQAKRAVYKGKESCIRAKERAVYEPKRKEIPTLKNLDVKEKREREGSGKSVVYISVHANK